mmetsp:Transcript_30130/g.68430  ORF Transcript_30130/g.68430 Transcript_30130/m.68430 type:complete len:299 (-) Transcript_30130:12-908(-)
MNGVLEDLWPTEGARQHELHENGRGVPRHVGDRDGVPGKVLAFAMLLQPGQLLPDLRKLSRTGGLVHAAGRCTKLGLVGGQVHAPLGVGEARLRAVWRGDVEVVDAYQQLHVGACLRGGQGKGGHGAQAQVLIFKIFEDDVALKDAVPGTVDEGGHLLQWVHGCKLWALQVCIRHDPPLDDVLQALEPHPDPDASRIVAVNHVKEYGLLLLAFGDCAITGKQPVDKVLQIDLGTARPWEAGDQLLQPLIRPGATAVDLREDRLQLGGGDRTSPSGAFQDILQTSERVGGHGALASCLV